MNYFVKKKNFWSYKGFDYDFTEKRFKLKDIFWFFDVEVIDFLRERFRFSWSEARIAYINRFIDNV